MIGVGSLAALVVVSIDSTEFYLTMTMCTILHFSALGTLHYSVHTLRLIIRYLGR